MQLIIHVEEAYRGLGIGDSVSRGIAFAHDGRGQAEWVGQLTIRVRLDDDFDLKRYE